MRVLFLDIDGYAVKADIQKYVSQIELFGDEPIKDFEYIKKCIQFMLEEAKISNDKNEIEFIQNVYKFASVNMFEMLKEHRDCFLEYDNLLTFEDKKKYIENYQKNPVIEANSNEIPRYMEYIIYALKYAKLLIETEYKRVEREGGEKRLPFKTINEDNDIIKYTEDEDPLKRATSALKRMEMYAMNQELGRDDFLTACMMASDKKIVDYDRIYQKENILPGLADGLKYLLDNNLVDIIVGCSHYTGPREANAKRNLFSKELPFILMLPESLLMFHNVPAQMGKRRERSSKNNQIDIMKNIIAKLFNSNTSDIECILGDDSLPNLVGLTPEKIGLLFRKRSLNEINLGVDTPTDSRFFRQFSWNKEELAKLFETIQKQDKNSKALKYSKR